jgi:hypothetical protein
LKEVQFLFRFIWEQQWAKTRTLCCMKIERVISLRMGNNVMYCCGALQSLYIEINGVSIEKKCSLYMYLFTCWNKEIMRCKYSQVSCHCRYILSDEYKKKS